jgi:hypothetical protein
MLAPKHHRDLSAYYQNSYADDPFTRQPLMYKQDGDQRWASDASAQS